MSDHRQILERLGERAGFPSDSFERLAKRRARKRRTTRITAGVVALIVAAAGTLGLYALAGGPSPRPADDPASGFFALWPETEYADALAAQQRVASGPDWRRHHEETARLFAVDVLGWSDAIASCAPLESANQGADCSYGAPHVDSHVWVYRERSDPMPDPLVVRVQRLIGREWDGIWSVTKVASPDIDIDLEPGASIQLGSLVPGRIDMERVEHGDFSSIGVSVETPCGRQTQGGDAEAGGIRIGSDGLEDCGTAALASPLTEPTRGILLALRTRGGFPIFHGPDEGIFLPDLRSQPDIRILSLFLLPVRVQPADSSSPQSSPAAESSFGYGRIPLGPGAPCPEGPFAMASSDEIRFFGEQLLDGATDPEPREGNARLVWDLLDASTHSTFENREEFEAGFMAIEHGYPGGQVVGTGAVPPYHIDPRVVERCGQEVAEHAFYVELYWPEGESIAGVRLIGRPDGLRLWYVEPYMSSGA